MKGLNANFVHSSLSIMNMMKKEDYRVVCGGGWNIQGNTAQVGDMRKLVTCASW